MADEEPITDADGDGRFVGEPETATPEVPQDGPVGTPGSPAEVGRVITDPAVRRAVYGAYTVIAALATLTTVGFATAGAVPAWLGITNAVVAAGGAYASFLAAANAKGKP